MSCRGKMLGFAWNFLCGDWPRQWSVLKVSRQPLEVEKVASGFRRSLQLGSWLVEAARVWAIRELFKNARFLWIRCPPVPGVAHTKFCLFHSKKQSRHLFWCAPAVCEHRRRFRLVCLFPELAFLESASTATFSWPISSQWWGGFAKQVSHPTCWSIGFGCQPRKARPKTMQLGLNVAGYVWTQSATKAQKRTQRSSGFLWGVETQCKENFKVQLLTRNATGKQPFCVNLDGCSQERKQQRLCCNHFGLLSSCSETPQPAESSFIKF